MKTYKPFGQVQCNSCLQKGKINRKQGFYQELSFKSYRLHNHTQTDTIPLVLAGSYFCIAIDSPVFDLFLFNGLGVVIW